MAPKTLASLAQATAYELGAALPARKAAADFALHFSLGSEAETLKATLSGMKAAETRLQNCGAAPDDHGPALGRLAAEEAAALEREAGFLNAWLPPSAGGLVHANVRLVAGILWEARYGEGRAKAMLSARRKLLRLPGFDEALELAPENELLFLAMRRFSRILLSGENWTQADLEWLRQRASTVPTRLRLHAAKLLSAAEALAHIKLPEEMEDLRRPFLQFGYDPEPALAWGVAGFEVTEALAWGTAGFPWADQAQAWKARGFAPKEASVWAQADLLPDEASAFRACGAQDPETARKLRAALGDVEHLLTWHRSGFDAAEVLRLRAEGVADVKAALAQRKAAAKSLAAAMLAPEAEALPTPSELLRIEATLPAPSAPAKAAAPAAKGKRSAGPAADWTPEGGAWIGWAVFNPAGEPAAPGKDALSRKLAGGCMDVAVASEGVALPTMPFSAADLHVEESWQGALDLYRGGRGLDAEPGRWQLVAMAPMQARLHWGLLFRTLASPWSQAFDFDAHETWEQRWKRRAEEIGDPGAKPTCLVTRTATRGWAIAAPGSVVEHSGEAPLALDGTTPEGAWREAVDRFCQVMGLGKLEAGWHLLAQEEGA